MDNWLRAPPEDGYAGASALGGLLKVRSFPWSRLKATLLTAHYQPEAVERRDELALHMDRGLAPGLIYPMTGSEGL